MPYSFFDHNMERLSFGFNSSSLIVGLVSISTAIPNMSVTNSKTWYSSFDEWVYYRVMTLFPNSVMNMKAIERMCTWAMK